jgi:hypothetical protein
MGSSGMIEPVIFKADALTLWMKTSSKYLYSPLENEHFVRSNNNLILPLNVSFSASAPFNTISMKIFPV